MIRAFARCSLSLPLLLVAGGAFAQTKAPADAPASAPAAEAPASAPAAEALPEVPESEAWRQQRPASGQPRAPVLPVFWKTVLSNGLTLYVAREDNLPLVSFNMVLKGGASQDPLGQGGLTNLTFGMLEEGAGDRDALAFSDRVADLGATFGGGAARDQGSIGISGLSRESETMLGLLADAVTRPRLAAEDFDRLKGQTLASLTRRRGSPQGLATEYLPGIVYGDRHPYGHPPNGTLGSVKALTLTMVKAQYKRLFSPRHAALIAVGAVDLDTMRALAEKAFGGWTNPGEDLRSVPALRAKRRRRIILVDLPGAPQTFALMGRPMFGRGHPDQVNVQLANAVFGGTFASRLNMNLREEKGYTYGASSQAAFRTGTGVLLAYSALRADVTVPGVREFFNELSRLRKNPPTPAEVADAKAGRTRSLTGQFQTIGAAAGAASALFVYDLPLDYFAQLPERYGGATLKAIQGAAKTYFRPELMQVVLVGDAKATLPRLRKAGFGRIQVVKPNRP